MIDKINREIFLPIGHLSVILSMYFIHTYVAYFYFDWIFFTIPLCATAMTLSLSIIHESAHNTYFASKTANSILGRLMGQPLLLNFSLYKHEHINHHLYQGMQEDSETKIRINSIRDLVSHLLFNVHFLELWYRSIKLDLDRQNFATRMDAGTLAIVSVGVLASTISNPEAIILFFWIPLFLNLVLDAIIGLPEHAQIGSKKGDSVPTRNLRAGNLTTFLLYWVNFHSAHHKYPNLSGPNLEAKTETITYLAFYKAIFHSLKTKDQLL